jgi:hypothetical protein
MTCLTTLRPLIPGLRGALVSCASKFFGKVGVQATPSIHARALKVAKRVVEALEVFYSWTYKMSSRPWVLGMQPCTTF